MIWICHQNELNMIEQGQGVVSVGVLVCGIACTSSHDSVTSSGRLKTIHWQQPTVNSKQSIDDYRFHRKKIVIRTAVHTFTRLQLSTPPFSNSYYVNRAVTTNSRLRKLHKSFPFFWLIYYMIKIKCVHFF